MYILFEVTIEDSNGKRFIMQACHFWKERRDLALEAYLERKNIVFFRQILEIPTIVICINGIPNKQSILISGSDGRVKWNRKSAVNLRKLAQQILASRRKLIKNFTKNHSLLGEIFD